RELFNDPQGLERIRAAVSKIYDLERICSKIQTSGANTTDLISLRLSAEALSETDKILAGLDMPLLKADFAHLDLLEDIRELIQNAVYESDGEIRRFSAEPKIRAGWNAELDELRELSENGKDFLMQIEARERERTGISTLKIKYNKVFGYFIEVSNGKKDLVPDDYIRKQTLANSERYFTEELKETENKIADAESRLGVVEARLFAEVQSTVREASPRIQQAARQAAELDVYASFARRALDSDYICPEIRDSGSITITGGRHPVVEQMTGRSHFISNNTHLDPENRLMLLTGPNMAGKSTYIRQTALIVLMAQTGSFVPAESADIGICDRIFTRVGASDDLGTGQSTFMVEMTEVSNILRNATEDSLVILDEIGRGTSTFDGISIAWAICENLLDRQVKTMFATHYHELTELEALHPGIVNYSIAVKETTAGVLFLRKIRRGAADQSYGIEVAKLAGFPKPVTDRAQEILAGLEANPVQGLPETHVHESSQLSFFTPQEPPDDRTLKAVKMLEKASPDDMSPRQAQDFVYELVKLVQEDV
ncbi:MAG: DNA mismatch repair protein MutS, partial [Eubacteriaceae bacterium]